jgi:hypothetical protein
VIKILEDSKYNHYVHTYIKVHVRGNERL